MNSKSKIKASGTYFNIKFYFTLIIGMSFMLMNVNPAQKSTSALAMPDGIEAAGEFSPLGPPQQNPGRIEAGKSCIVDIIQSYTISGTLEFNYRILVKVPGGSPSGTFDEEWIAYGKFKGKINNIPSSGNISCTAKVKAGGEINGIMVPGQGLEGELQVYGNFKDGKLSYKGLIKNKP